MSNYSPDSHIYLYAKGWYKKGDVVEDLKKILGRRSGVNAEYIRKQDIIIVLSGIVWPEMTEYRFLEFLSHIVDAPIFPNREEDSTPVDIRIIKALLKQIVLMPVKRDGEVLVDISDPDPELLPLAKEGIAYERYK